MKIQCIPFKLLISYLIILFRSTAIADPQDAMVYIHNAQESENDHRYDYHWEILRTALEYTERRFGPFQLYPSSPMTEKRQVFELSNQTGKLTVMFRGADQNLENNLTPVRIPVDLNLAGYMIFLIRKEDQDLFDGINTLDDLRQYSIGLGADWLDIEVLESNGFNVITGTNYDGLFRMLLNKRFDCFQRSAVEILDEYDQRKSTMGNLHIEKNLILYYPWPMYFWFSDNAEGILLAERAEEGMLQMIEDGTYYRIFDKYFEEDIARLNLSDRRLLRISNPLLSPETPLDDDRLWFDPQNHD